MGKKKGGKGKKEKSEDGLPPPPDMDSYKEGPREALLTFRIQGKEDTILQHEGEAEDFKDRNYRQKEKNYDLKQVQNGYRKALLQQALQYESQQAEKEEVTAEAVEMALWEKLQLARDMEAELEDMEDTIVAVGQKLEMERQELEKWTNYRENTVCAEVAYIKEMKQKIEEMTDEEKKIESEQESRMSAAKRDIEAKWQKRMEKEKEAVSERLLDSLDDEGRAELMDNGWLKREILVVRETVTELQREVDHLEQRNLHLLEKMQQEQLQELQTSLCLLQASTGRTHLLSRTSPSTHPQNHTTPTLPSLVDISKTTTDTGSGRLGQAERHMLNINGCGATLATPPDSTHLPPLAQQKCTSSALPTRTNWPITAHMLDSIT